MQSQHICCRKKTREIGENCTVTFIIGLVILIVGAAIYGKFCEKVFGPDNRETPAFTKQDGVDYVPMKSWKNMLINLLNIAGTGPIFGPIQGILFGPIAFITITYIFNAKIGFGLPWGASYAIGAVAAVAYVAAILAYGKKRSADLKK